MTPLEMQQVMEKLDVIKADVDFIKKHAVLIDPDTILTKEEEKITDEALKEYKEGKTTSLEDLKKELELEDQNA